VEYILHLNPICDAYGVGGAIADAPMIDYSLDLVEVNGEDRSKRGKRGGRKRLLRLKDGNRMILPETTPAPEGATDVLSSLRDLYSLPPDVGALRQRVLDQLGTGDFEL
jgi:nicotinate phosphoribosyltransferase